MVLERFSPCKVNLLLNVLGRRPDGFHELETLLHPVAVHDRLTFEAADVGIALECSHPKLPADERNLVHRAATVFLEAARIRKGVRIRLDKRIPLEAGLGGGSGDAATTLLALNELFESPLSNAQLSSLAAQLGSDVAFFLQTRPAVATGRGEKIQTLDFFPALQGHWILLVHPGFGVPTAWAYRELARCPEALEGKPGRVERLLGYLQNGDLAAGLKEFYNALESPVFFKYPLLAVLREFLEEQGAAATLMSGSGSTVFGLFREETKTRRLQGEIRERFGRECWTAAAPLTPPVV